MKSIALIWCSLALLVSTAETRDCVTPSNLKGFCVPHENCTKIYRHFLVKSIVLLDDFTDDFEARDCSTEEEKNFICCDPEPYDFINCGKVDSSYRIANGMDALFHEYPWVAQLEYEERGIIELRCGGSLITPNYVLTAAHCLDASLVSVRLGEHRISTNPDCQVGLTESEENNEVCSPPFERIEIETQILYPEYMLKRVSGADIALLRLKRPATLGANIGTICLPIKNKLRKEDYDKKITVMGFGITDNHETLPDVLQKAIINRRDCNSNIYENFDDESQFCAGGTNLTGTCLGDSGGSLVIFNPLNSKQWLQIGIVSSGPQCGVFLYIPSIHVKVENHIDWILENVKLDGY